MRAEDHCAINLSLYRRAAGAPAFTRRWTMTERGARDLSRDARSLRIGPSALAWTDAGLDATIDEWTVPWPRPVRGCLRLRTGALPAQEFALDTASRHLWQPICPRGRLEVDLDVPGGRWRGDAYLDANRGERPLARDFRGWDWSRRPLSHGGSRVRFDLQDTDGGTRAFGCDIARDGRLSTPTPPPARPLPRSSWGLGRATSDGAEALAPPSVLATLESGPFYCRSLLHAGEGPGLAMHEHLSLERFDARWVQALLPFRMPRRAR